MAGVRGVLLQSRGEKAVLAAGPKAHHLGYCALSDDAHEVLPVPLDDHPLR